MTGINNADPGAAILYSSGRISNMLDGLTRLIDLDMGELTHEDIAYLKTLKERLNELRKGAIEKEAPNGR